MGELETVSIKAHQSTLQQFAAFNVWANLRIPDAVCRLSEAQLKQEITGSFPGIIKTLLHLPDAESIWWQRLTLVE